MRLTNPQLEASYPDDAEEHFQEVRHFRRDDPWRIFPEKSVVGPGNSDFFSVEMEHSAGKALRTRFSSMGV